MGVILSPGNETKPETVLRRTETIDHGGWRIEPRIEPTGGGQPTLLARSRNSGRR